MVFQSLDTPTYYLFLALGLVFALSGLTFIFRGKADENAARFEFLGLKFQSSSAGTLVFLIGVGFLMIPLFVPRVEGATISPGDAIDGGGASSPPTGGGTAIQLPQVADAPEVEPNNAITQANQFALGFGARGEIDKDRRDYEDWYVVDTSGTEQSELRAQIRSAWGGCKLIVFDATETELGYKHCDQSGGSGYVEFFNIESDRIFLRVVFNGGSGAKRSEYEVFLHTN